MNAVQLIRAGQSGAEIQQNGRRIALTPALNKAWVVKLNEGNEI
jgi:hypothetical protein